MKQYLVVGLGAEKVSQVHLLISEFQNCILKMQLHRLFTHKTSTPEIKSNCSHMYMHSSHLSPEAFQGVSCAIDP